MAKANEIKYLTAIETEKPKKKSAPKKAADKTESE